MVLGQILKVGSFVVKHRKTIYRVLTAQDRYIDRAMRAGRYGRQARRGVRHGALAGSIIGPLIAPDSPGNDNAIQTRKPQYPSRTPYKTRNRQTVRYSSRSSKYYQPDKRGRCPDTRKY